MVVRVVGELVVVFDSEWGEHMIQHCDVKCIQRIYCTYSTKLVVISRFWVVRDRTWYKLTAKKLQSAVNVSYRNNYTKSLYDIKLNEQTV